MTIKIHRGAKQIGGCVTEISTEKAKVFIDLGADLTSDKEKANSKLSIYGLTAGNAENSVLLITHYHGDHIGRISQALPSIHIYMGETAKKINMAKSKKLEKAELIDEKEMEFLKKTKTFKPGEKLKFGDIEVTALMTDHSAFDAYSFLIEANGERIFYTGDFRLHGLRGGKMLKKGFFEKYAKNIDYLICEGTNISKKEKAQTEFELKQEAMKLFANPKHKYVFVFCSSVNIDRIFAFYRAYNEVFKGKRPFLCDKYQEEILKIVSENHGKFSFIYNFEPSTAAPKNGFCFLVRCKHKKMLDKYFAKHPGESFIIYSMWKGYLDEKNAAKNENYIKFLKPHPYKYLHTSGHADAETLEKIANIIKPKHIIPIHTENPEGFLKLFKNAKLSTLFGGFYDAI